MDVPFLSLDKPDVPLMIKSKTYGTKNKEVKPLGNEVFNHFF